MHWLSAQSLKIPVRARCIDYFGRDAFSLFRYDAYLIYWQYAWGVVLSPWAEFVCVVCDARIHLLPSYFWSLPSRTANFLDLQSMLFPTFILKRCILFFRCCRIQAFPQVQKYGWLTNQTIYVKYFLFLFSGLFFKLIFINWGSYGCLFYRFSTIITYILGYRKFLVFWK